jgi:hypothetical protein
VGRLGQPQGHGRPSVRILDTHDLLVKISGGWPMARLDELLPDNWAAAREAER